MSPLLTLVGICGTGFLMSQGSSQTVETGMMLAFCSSVLTCILAYGYFAVKNPDALRSESYSMGKMVIEKGVIGDSTTGPVKRIAIDQTHVDDQEYGSDDGVTGE